MGDNARSPARRRDLRQTGSHESKGPVSSNCHWERQLTPWKTNTGLHVPHDFFFARSSLPESV